MGDKSKIEWTDASWNPVIGCTRVSEGCRNCYAESLAAGRLAHAERYKGIAEMTPSGPRWTGEVRFVPEVLDQPLRWRKPRRIFVNSMSDLFHETVSDETIARIFAVMNNAKQHVFQVLTKRPKRMVEFLERCSAVDGWVMHNGSPSPAYGGTGIIVGSDDAWPLPNVWLGTSVEDQKAADERIPLLLETPAAVQFLSCEPLLGPLELEECLWKLDWVIVGGESGPNARPMHPDWARSLRTQCKGAGVPFFFKQWGEYAPRENFDPSWVITTFDKPRSYGWKTHRGDPQQVRRFNGITGELIEPPTNGYETHKDVEMLRVGKKNAGALLDGREWHEFPEVN